MISQPANMVNAPNLSLRIILVAHLVLSVWASMTEEFLPTAYIYSNAFMLAFGVWAIIAPESADSILLFMVLNIVNIVTDIIFLGIFTPHSSDMPIRAGASTYKFSLGMAIVNLLLRPFSTFVLYRLYQDRGGQQGEFGIPGFNPSGGHPRGYEDIDQPVPSATDNTYDQSSPTHSAEYKSPMP